MTWNITAMGHADGTGDEQAAAELELANALAGVLSDPRFGCVSSSITGAHVKGSPHDRQVMSAPAEPGVHRGMAGMTPGQRAAELAGQQDITST